MKDRIADLNFRPTYKYITHVEEFITSTHKLFDENKKNSGLKPLREALESIRRTLQNPAGTLGVKPMLTKYEEERTKSLGTSDSLDKEYEKARVDKLTAERNYLNMPKQYENDLAHQKELRNRTDEKINREQLDKILKIGKETQEYIKLSNEIALKDTAQQQKLNKLNQEIQGCCCGASFFNKDRLVKLQNLQAQINLNASLQQNIRQHKTDLEAEEAEIKKLTNDLEREQKEIDKLIDTYEERRKIAQKKKDSAAEKLSAILTKIEQEIADQCRVVDRDTIYNLVHLQARIANFYRLVKEVSKKDKTTSAVLDAVLTAKSDWQKKFNNTLGIIFYPTIEAKSGVQLYDDYTKLAEAHNDDIEEFEAAEYSPNDNHLIDLVIPEIKSGDGRELHHSSLGTTNTFFPNAKKKKSDVAAALDPGAPTMSNSSSSSL